MAKAKTPGNGTSRKKQMVSVSETGNGHALESTSNFTSMDLEGEIRRRAYELYERRGCTPGHESEDWLSAEREIASRYQHSSV